MAIGWFCASPPSWAEPSRFSNPPALYKLRPWACPSIVCLHGSSAKVQCAIAEWLPVLQRAIMRIYAPSLDMPSSSWPRVLRRSAHQNRMSSSGEHQAQPLEIMTGERGNAQARHQYPWAVWRFLICLGNGHQPNRAVKGTPTDLALADAAKRLNVGQVALFHHQHCLPGSVSF